MDKHPIEQGIADVVRTYELLDRILPEPDPARAVRLALEKSAGRTPVVIAGSLFLVGEIKRLRLFK